MVKKTILLKLAGFCVFERKYGIKLNPSHMVVFHYMQDWITSGYAEVIEHDGEYYSYVSCKKLVEDLPSLHVKTRKEFFESYLKDLIDAHILNIHIDQTGDFTKEFFSVTDEAQKIIVNGYLSVTDRNYLLDLE